MSKSDESKAKSWNLLHDITGHAEERFTERFPILCHGLDSSSIIRKMDEEIREVEKMEDGGKIPVPPAVMDAFSRLYGSDEFRMEVDQGPRPFFFMSRDSELPVDSANDEPIFVVGENRQNYRTRDGKPHTHAILTVLNRAIFNSMLSRSMALSEKLSKQSQKKKKVAPEPVNRTGSRRSVVPNEDDPWPGSVGQEIWLELEVVAEYFDIPTTKLMRQMLRKKLDTIRVEHPEIFEPPSLKLDDIL